MSKAKKQTLTHSELIEIGARWLKNQCRCSVILKELATYTSHGETPDIIGFNSWRSLMIEAKTSRSDFFADRKKIFRQHQEFGMGQYRFIICPAELLQPNEIYDGWGLLWVRGKKVYQQNCDVTGGSSHGVSCFAGNITSERSMLLSALRRINNFKPVVNDGQKIEVSC
jgi:hypothetical protein